MNAETAILKVGIALLVGYIGGKVAQKIKLPNVSGYLLAGLIIGPSLGLLFPTQGFISPKEMLGLNFIKEIALAFIAFSIGSEFSISNLRKLGKRVATITLLEVLGAVLLVFLLIFFIPKPSPIMPKVDGKLVYTPFGTENIAFSLILSAMAATTAPAATLLVIKQYRAYGPVTNTVLPIAALDDIFGIVAFGILFAISKVLLPHHSGSTTDFPVAYGIMKPFVEVISSLVVGGIIGFILSYFANKYSKVRDEAQAMALASVVICLGLSYFIKHTSKEYVEVSPLLANIMVGAMVANLVKKPHRTYNALNDFSNPFYILFFTLSGASLDLGIFARTSALLLALVVLYIIGRAVGKYFGASMGAKMVHADPMVQKYIGFALLPQGGVSLGLIVIIGESMKEFGATISAIILISTLIYETTGPLFSKFAITKAGEINGMDKFNTISGLTEN